MSQPWTTLGMGRGEDGGRYTVAEFREFIRRAGFESDLGTADDPPALFLRAYSNPMRLVVDADGVVSGAFLLATATYDFEKNERLGRALVAAGWWVKGPC